ncbi:hypothetical protein [Dermacoccus abyssi]|uniref:hypothetical protein n=1 Tax=Dermacoccus abyssi TaxID=322596 RepID=UPI002AD2D915|nr:hypothetical protein [Dermacoccus abyssi]
MLGPQGVVLVDVDLGEERLVAHSAVGVVAAGVDRGAVLQYVECLIEMLAGVGVVAVLGVELVVDLVELRRDPVLLALEHVERDGSGVVRPHQGLLLVLQLVPTAGEVLEVRGLGRHEVIELVVEHSGQRLAPGRGDLHAVVVGLDQALDVADEDGLTGAVGALGVTARAHEVGVDVAGLVPGVGDHEP